MKKSKKYAIAGWVLMVLSSVISLTCGLLNIQEDSIFLPALLIGILILGVYTLAFSELVRIEEIIKGHE